MSPIERSLLNYLFLAGEAARKGQRLGRDRFLVLAISKAGQSGWLEVAEQCLPCVARHSPGHLLQRFETASEALKDDTFVSLARQQERNCSPERAEQLAAELDFDADQASEAHAQQLKSLFQELLQPLLET